MIETVESGDTGGGRVMPLSLGSLSVAGNGPRPSVQPPDGTGRCGADIQELAGDARVQAATH